MRGTEFESGNFLLSHQASLAVRCFTVLRDPREPGQAFRSPTRRFRALPALHEAAGSGGSYGHRVPMDTVGVAREFVLFKKKSRAFGAALIFEEKKPGNFLLSHQAPLAVPSAPEGLASVFGMGTGVSPLSWLPGFN